MPEKYVHGIKLYYEQTGEGEPLLFIHGLGSSTRDWDDQVPFFAPHYRVLTYDLRGHGQSDKPHGSYTIALFAADTAELLRSLGCGSAHVVGLSLGGTIAFELAVIAPELVKSLVIVNSAPEVPRSSLKLRLIKLLADVQRWLIIRLYGMRKLSEVILTHLLPGPEFDERRQAMIERWSANDNHAYMASYKAMSHWSVADQLESLTVPTLVLSASNDYTPLDYKRAYTARMPHAELVVIPDSRHLTPVERPQQFNEALLAFLQKQTAPAPSEPEQAAPPAPDSLPTG